MTDAAPSAANNHLALRFIVRATGWILGLGSAFVLVGAVLLLAISILHRNGHVPMQWLIAILFLSAVAIYALLAKAGFDMARKISATTVENCAFVYAVLSARVLYYALMLLLKAIGVNPLTPLFSNTPAPDHGLSRLGLFAFLSFFLFHYFYAAGLKQVLGLNPSFPPPGNGNDDSIPEFPQKSPLIELPESGGQAT